MKALSLCLSVLLVVVLSACDHSEQTAVQLSKDFFASLSERNNDKTKVFYPKYADLHVTAKSDEVDIDESEVTTKNDTIAVRCFNSYTDDFGTFKQDSVTLFVANSKDGKLHICDSRGLVSVDHNLKYLGMAMGAFPRKQPNNQDLAKRISVVNDIVYDEYIAVRSALQQKVKVQNWSWETLYNGEPRGEVRIVNGTYYPIESIKYYVDYYNSNGNFMTSYDNEINKILSPGETYDFSFWSPNVRYPHKAYIRLDFPETTIENIIRNKSYSGNEYKNYIASHK